MPRNEDIPPVETEVDAALLAGLASRAGGLESLIADLISTVKLNRLARSFVIFVTVFLVAVGSVNLWNTYQTKKSTNLIKSCTDPSGECYKDARRSASTNVTTIKDVSVAAAYCAKQPENVTLEQVEECVRASITHK